MTIRKLRETRNIYNVLCIVDVVIDIIIAAFRPLHMITTTYMYSRQDKIGLALCTLFVLVFMLFLHHHHIYSIVEYRYRVAVHRRKEAKKEQ